jgi:hypothetical protein
VNTAEPQTTTATLSHRSAALRAALRVEHSGGSLTPIATDTQSGRAARAPKAALRRAPVGSLVLAQSWVPVSVSRLPRADLRQSALRAAEAFSLLSSELTTRRGEAKPPTA